MSKKQPLNINMKGSIEVEPGGVYPSRVVPSGNGAVINFFKRFIGKDVFVVLVDKIKNKTRKSKHSKKLNVSQTRKPK